MKGLSSGIDVVRKRDGSLDKYNLLKIKQAIFKASHAVDFLDNKILENCTNEVDKLIWQRYKNIIPTVENIQDIVEEVLVRNGLTNVAKSYIIYREERHKLREVKEFYNVSDHLKLSLNAIHVLQKRYLLRDFNGKIIENPEQMFRRVAHAVAQAELIYNKNPGLIEEQFFHLMTSLEFLPNSPTLMNAGTRNGQLSACFVLPIDDSLNNIFDSLKAMALIQQSGGGTGFSFSKLRADGSVIQSTKGIASGPVSFMQIFDKTTDVIKQGGKRRGANMAVLRVDHPDILNFITAKEQEGNLKNFNISVGVTGEFLEAVKKNSEYDLTDPRTKKVVKKLKAKNVFDLIVSKAWQTGDPGLIFLDEINRKHTLYQVIEATNPCGEQPLLPFESCNLGSLNLVKFVKDGKIDFNKLRDRVRLAVHFLDNVIDVNNYTLPQIQEITKQNRKIGLGLMGWADALILLGIQYDSDKALKLAEFVMDFITSEARRKSYELARERGNFPAFKLSKLSKKYEAMRNATVTTIAPTGTISIIAGVSSGIEPLFAISFVRDVLEGTKLFETNPIFENIAHSQGFFTPELMVQIARTGSVQLMPIPKDVKKLFLTAHEISPEWHVKMQAAFQKYTDNGVSKTVNLPENATIKDVADVFWLAYKLKCKGVTIFRYNSKNKQVLYLGEDIDRQRPVIAASEFSGGCPLYHCGN